MNEKYFVVAGNHKQYKDFIKRKCKELCLIGKDVSFSNFAYATYDTLKGHSNPHGWFYGTWKERSDIGHLMVQLIISTREDSPSRDTLLKLADELIKT
jgi:hypothetical protein